MQVRAAIFDLDGVLADSSRTHFLAWRRLAMEEGIYFNEAINERMKGVSRLESLEILLEGSDRTFSEREKADLAARKNRHYQELTSSFSRQDLLPGAFEVLCECRARGIRTALASSSKNAPRLIKGLEIAPLLDYVADASFVTHHKPHPEIFLKAANGLEVDPRQCIALEDSAAGVQAIKAAGMYAIGIGSKEALHQADAVIESLADFSWDLVI